MLMSHLQRDAYLDYVPTHRQGVTFIILTTSVNAVAYNLVRGWLGLATEPKPCVRMMHDKPARGCLACRSTAP